MLTLRLPRLPLAILSAVCLVAASLPALQAPPASPSPEEIRALLERMIASSHRSDAEDAFYARTEHWIERRHSADDTVTLDRVYRVYPTGTGTVKLVVRDAGAQVTPEKYRDSLRELEQDLVWALDPDEPRQHARVEKFQRRTADRYHAVEGFRDAYNVTWLGTENLPGAPAGAPLTKLLLDPKPGGSSGSIATELLAASRLTLWVEPHSGAVVCLDAELVRDLTFGGGLLGKIDKGGRVHIEQAEVAPGIWLPRLTANDVQGRKLFSHQESVRTVKASDFLRVGPPADLLPLVRRELSNAALRVPSP